MRTMFDCGCSALKVAAGRCDIYDDKGQLRAVAVDPLAGVPEPHRSRIRWEAVAAGNAALDRGEGPGYANALAAGAAAYHAAQAAPNKPRLPVLPGIDSGSALACCGRVDCPHIDPTPDAAKVEPARLSPLEAFEAALAALLLAGGWRQDSRLGFWNDPIDGCTWPAASAVEIERDRLVRPLCMVRHAHVPQLVCTLPAGHEGPHNPSTRRAT